MFLGSIAYRTIGYPKTKNLSVLPEFLTFGKEVSVVPTQALVNVNLIPIMIKCCQLFFDGFHCNFPIHEFNDSSLSINQAMTSLNFLRELYHRYHPEFRSLHCPDLYLRSNCQFLQPQVSHVGSTFGFRIWMSLSSSMFVLVDLLFF